MASLLKKWSFPLRMSSVNVSKSAGNCGNCGFGHIYWRSPQWKTLCSAVRLWWSFFAKIFIDWRSLAIFCRNLGFRCLTVFLECVTLTVSYHVYFFRVSQVSSMLHEGSVGWVHSKECSFILTYTFLAFFCFSQKKLVFLSFSFLFFL